MRNHIYETTLFIKLSYASINKIVQIIRKGEKYDWKYISPFRTLPLSYISQKYDDACLCLRFALINQDYCIYIL